MLAEQALKRPCRRQLARIPDHQFIGIHADLNRNRAGVILVNHRVEYRLAQRRFGHRIGLDPLQSLVGNQGLHVFEPKDIDDLIDLGKQVAADHVLIAQIGIAPEKSDLQVRAADESLRQRVKQ